MCYFSLLFQWTSDLSCSGREVELECNAMSTKASLDLVIADWQKVDIGIVACFLPAKLLKVQ